ncbi:hypothetical protein JCM11641_005631 [Rhodosporidiobolus odoratus]
MTSKTAPVDAARVYLQRAIPTMPLPTVPPLSSPLFLTHTSHAGASHYAFELPEGEGAMDYERLEHVGDALLGAEVTLLIHERYPRLTVGARTAIKSALVSNTTLSLLSVSLHFPEQILASQAQLWNTRNNPGIQACVFEAFLAQLDMEHGHAAVRVFLRAIYEQLLPEVVNVMRPFYSGQAEANAPGRNWIGSLMEWQAEKGFAAGRTVEFGPNQQSLEGAQGLWTVSCTVVDGNRPELAQPRTFGGSASKAAKAKMDAAYEACKWVGIA